MSPLRIAQVAPLFESVPPKLYGGTERVVSYLTEELVRQGHEVTLFASGDSITQAKLIAPCERALRLDDRVVDHMSRHILMLELLARRASAFDIVHSHIDYLPFPVYRRLSIPTVTTLHGRLDLPELADIFAEFSDAPVVSISMSQRQPLPQAHWVGNVDHGLPDDLYTFHPKAGEYLAFLGRISPEKRVDSAISLAIAENLPLKISAKIDQVDATYFETVIKPMLDHPLIEFLGEIGDSEKDGFLGNALALLFPIDWPEPFGLVMVEALACGTPILARCRGSVPEIMESGTTGFVYETEAEGQSALRNIRAIDRRACRKAFEQRFTARIMAQNYLEIYRALLESPPNA
ncbi:MAG: glycosyltransferase family 4 protein [Myxococcales bacterium]|nr:glycosyltransferase family 4 protein [Myxococcales bacterium]MCB9709469.1 glycosyltransferase family 4 protein [Myxococcales bacterium]